MMSTVRPAGWLFWSCITAMLLFLSCYAQRELQGFRDVPEPSGISQDFGMYYVAGRVALKEGNGKLYSYMDTGNPQSAVQMWFPNSAPESWREVGRAHGIDAKVPFHYPPFFALMMAPISLLPPRVALYVWRELNTALLLLSVLLTLSLLRVKPLLPTFIISSVAALSFFPFVETMFEGQVNVLVLFFWTLGTCFVAREKSFWSALCFALGTMVKVTAVIVVPIFLLRRRWKWLLAYLVWMTLMLVIGIRQLGWENHFTYFAKVVPSLSCGVPGLNSKSIPTLIQNLYLGRVPLERREDTPTSMPSGLCSVTKIVGLGLYAAVLLYFWKNNRSARHLPYEVALIALVALLISPVTWRHHFVLAILPLLYMWGSAAKNATWCTNRKLVWLALTTLALGTPLAQYFIVKASRPSLQLVFATIVPGATLLLLGLSLSLYGDYTNRADPSITELIPRKRA
jgi:hypothetical protein